MKKIISLIILPISCSLLFGCNKSSSNAIELYSDSPKTTINDITYYFDNLTETNFSLAEYRVSFRLNLISTSPEGIDFTLDNPYLIRESNRAKYEYAQGNFPKTAHLECDLNKNYTFSFTIPSSYKNTRYTFNIDGNGRKIVYHLYQMPDDVRPDVTINLHIGSSIYKVSKKYGEKFSHEWISPDYCYYCTEWYYDSKLTSKVSANYVVNGETDFYGSKISILKYQMPEATSSCFVSGYNYIPTTREIVIPRSFENKPVHSILAGAFNGGCVGLYNIYIPKIKISKSYNFINCRELVNVYFEGTAEEWNTMNEADFPSTTKIIFNTYK